MSDVILGLFLDGSTLDAAWLTGTAWRSQSTPCDGTAHDVHRAYGDIAADLPTARTVCVTLARPLASARTIDFPRMASSELEAVLSRDWMRYVIGIRPVPHDVAVRAVGRTWRAAFAPRETLNAIVELADANGWTNLSMMTADDALAGLTASPQSARRTRETCLIACDAAGPRHAVVTRNGEPIPGRRFTSHSTDADAIAFHSTARNPTAPVEMVIVGASIAAGTLAKAARALGIPVMLPEAGLPDDATAGVVLAAAGTKASPLLFLRAERQRNARAHLLRNLTRGLWAATLLAGIVAIAIAKSQTERRLASVRTARADIAGAVNVAMLSRATLEGRAFALEALAEHESNASRATEVIASITAGVPPDASLTSLRLAGDTVTVEGESARSATVYDALRANTVIEDVGLAAPVRQEVTVSGQPAERFAFRARVRPRATGSR